MVKVKNVGHAFIKLYRLAVRNQTKNMNNV